MACGIALAGSTLVAAEANKTGAEIYKDMCADCHGDKGQGVKGQYDEPLHGNRSVDALTKRIARTMPDDDPGSCVGEDATKVSNYIYDAFYSPRAWARLNPPQFDLARLTNDQYLISVTDLIGHFRPGFDRPPGAQRGLRAHYVGLVIEPPADPAPAPAAATPAPVATPAATPAPAAAATPTPANAKATPAVAVKKPEEKKKDVPKTQFDRMDAQVAFNFKDSSPDPVKMQPEQFSAHWEGSVFVDETGTYEFIVRSENGVRLGVNDTKNLLIDAWVSSGPEVREQKKSIFLLGGRPYPIALDFFKFKEKTASVQLLWKTPHGVVETIPQDHLMPERVRESFIVKTKFPADDRSEGYERGTGVSKEWDQATTEAALEVMEYVDDRLNEFTGTKQGAPDRVDKAKQFGRSFVETAFRRPLTDEDYQRYVEHQFAATKTPEQAIKRVVLLALKSPRFLYPEIPTDGPPDNYDVATRLALDLWDSIPDKQLLEAAQRGKLLNREQIGLQIKRMLGDLRTQAKMHGFYRGWLELERAETVSKDPQAFPEFDAQVLADLRKSLFLFLDQVIWSERSDYREVLQASYLLLNERLAKIYGKNVSGSGFQRVDFDQKQRAGVVTHPYLLAAFASSKQTSPIHRGVFLTRTIVGMTLKPPKAAKFFDDAKFDTHLTMREKITELTKNTDCMGCHGTINPLGFSLENYDAIGRWRTHDNNKPVDAVSDFHTDQGDTIRLTGARDLVKFAAENPDGHRAFIHLLVHHFVKQDVNVYGPDTLENLRQSFTSSGFNIRKLLADIAFTSATRGFPESDPKVADKTPTASATATAPKPL